MHFSSILSLILSCITHQLNINKCITKKYHEMTIEYLYLFVSWVDSFFQLHHLVNSEQHHFLSKCLKWIGGSSRIDFFIFVIAEVSYLNHEILIFICSNILFSYYESSFFFFPESTESNHFLLAHIPRMNESHDPGRPFKVAITTSALSTSSSTSCSLI